MALLMQMAGGPTGKQPGRWVGGPQLAGVGMRFLNIYAVVHSVPSRPIGDALCRQLFHASLLSLPASLPLQLNLDEHCEDGPEGLCMVQAM